MYSPRSTAWKHRITYVDRPASPFERAYDAAVRATKRWGHYLLLIPAAGGTFGVGYALIYSRAGWEAPFICAMIAIAYFALFAVRERSLSHERQ